MRYYYMEIKTVDKIMHLQESASDLDRCYPEKQESFRVTNVEYAIPESHQLQAPNRRRHAAGSCTIQGRHWELGGAGRQRRKQSL